MSPVHCEVSSMALYFLMFRGCKPCAVRYGCPSRYERMKSRLAAEYFKDGGISLICHQTYFYSFSNFSSCCNRNTVDYTVDLGVYLDE